jgi:hypothetical protein
MKVVRWLFVIALSLAADLASPVSLAPFEAFAGEASESPHGLPLRRGAPRLAARQAAPAIEPGAMLRWTNPGVPHAPASAPERAVRKIPPAASDGTPGPEDEHRRE